jgi:contractile injection system tube protein/LysM domain-containing protein
MALEKLRIIPQDSNLSEIVALFNPSTYSISKSVEYQSHRRKSLNAPLLSFVGGGSRTLSLQLFFDVTESPIVDGMPTSDVRALTNKLVELTQINRNTQRPPVCRIFWGSSRFASSDFPFTGVVNQLQQEFTFFDSRGTPLRANLNVSFTEFLGWGKSVEKDRRRTDPIFTTRVVRRGDTLNQIAAEVYGDPQAWRAIAEINGIDDPRRLEVGSALQIPETE